MITTNSERQARSRKARANAGGKQVAVMLTPAGAAALAKLLDARYALNAQECIDRALIAAARYA